MSFAPERLHQTVLAIAGELRHDPGLAAEMLRAERQFFGGLPDYAPEGPARASAQARFAEWFVLERESEHLGAVPIEAFGGISEPVRDALRATACGLFLVESVEPELRVRDVLRGEAFELETDATLRVGDVVVGRVYPGATDAVAPSPAAAILRDGGAVVAALQRDLRRAGIERQLTQAEIEAVLFRNAGELYATQAQRMPPERLEARLESLLREGGDQKHSAAEISAALDAARDGPGRVMGPVLESLAFDSAVDLDAARTVMLQLWNEHRMRANERQAGQSQTPQTPRAARPSPAADAGLGASIAARIDRGLAEHEDLEKLFADVEGMLGEGGDDVEEDDGEEDLPQGDLDALVTEYLWERGLPADSQASAALHAFAAHQRQLPVPSVYLESIRARELLAFLLRSYLAAAPTQRAARVRVEFDALRAFYDWAGETQLYDIQAPMRECEQTLIEPLPRLQRASLALSSDTVPLEGRRPDVLRVARIEAGSVEVVGAGTEPGWLDVPDAAPDLRPDDLIVAAVEPDGRDGLRIAGVAVVLPAGAADLLE